MAGEVSLSSGNTAKLARRWIAAALALTVVVWLAGLAALLAVANRVHHDIPVALAAKLPLLHLQPDLIFAGDSRMELQVDPLLAAQIAGQRAGYAVNLGYLAGEPLALLAAARFAPQMFRHAHLVVSVTPLISNEGIRAAVAYPPDVLARMPVWQQMTTFLPMRVGTLVRYVREAFQARLAADQNVATLGPTPRDYGLIKLPVRANFTWPDGIARHEHYSNWDITGFKAKSELGALCALVDQTRRLTVIRMPFAPRYDREKEPSWKAKDEEYAALLRGAAVRCRFEFVDIPAVPGLQEQHFSDEQHINVTGIPIVTRHLLTLLEN